MSNDTALMPMLERFVAPHVRWHRQRLLLLAALLPVMLRASTVNLAKLALDFEAKPASAYRRLQRFFAQAHLPQKAVAAVSLHLLPRAKQITVAIDRTEWHLGKTPVNVFMASAVHGGTAFPLAWIMLGKAGSTSAGERRALIDRLFALVPPERVGAVLADREFFGRALMGRLAERGVGSVIRLRKDAAVTHRGRTHRAEALFSDLSVGQSRRLRARRLVYGERAWIYAKRLPDGARGERRLLIVAGTVRRLLRRYAQRWGIEVLFLGLKSRGFDFETTHLRCQDRISTLVGVLAMAYGLAHAAGRDWVKSHPVALKKHGRLARSVFRVGLDRVRRVLMRSERQKWRVLVRLFFAGSVGTADAPV